MIQTISVYTTNGPDITAQALLTELTKHHNYEHVSKIRTSKIYRLEGITVHEAKKLTKLLLSEPINQDFTINEPVFSDATYQAEIAYKPGVMNPEVGSIFKSAHDLHINPKAIDVSTVYAFYSKQTAKTLAKDLQTWGLFNPMIEMIRTTNPATLQIKGQRGKTKHIPLRFFSDNELMKLSKNTLFLTLTEMQAIQKYFRSIKRDPTDCELEILAQTWSEHCVHKTFKADLIINGKKKSPLFQRIKETATFNKDIIVSSFVDNSGVIDFFDGYGISGKVETHNSPSAIEPYGGAMTGSGGVFRDILGTGTGAKPVVSTDIFCLAPPNLPDKDVPPGCLKPAYMLTKVVEGVRDYGNRVGIPTNNGSFHFHPGFRAKPTVAVGSFGLIPKKSAKKQYPKPNDLIITLGGKTGRDGIHGATFSSAEMTDETKTVSGSAVQIGNAIEEKRVIDLVLRLRDRGFIQAITDCGAGGFSSAIGELAEKTGAKVYLDQVPLKYKGLNPWEIFLSESQERMVIAIKPKDKKTVFEICKLFNVEASVIGEFTSSKKLEVFFSNETVANLSMEFLHNGLPKQTLIGTLPEKIKVKNKKPTKNLDLNKILKKVLAHPTVSSKEPIIRMYDHNVQGTNALHPFGGVHFDGPNDGSIVTPLIDKPYGLVTTHGLNPSMMEHDCYNGSVWAITEAVSNYVSVGGDISHAALVDNFIWPFPDEESLAELDLSVDACYDTAKKLHMPFVSGKDSLSSTYRFPNNKLLKIPPVLLISAFGKIPDVKKTVSSDFKKTNSTVVLIGNIDTKNMSGTIFSEIMKTKGNGIPKVDTKNVVTILKTITKEIQKGTILSCHDISEGGLITSLSEMCFGGDVGARIDITNIEGEDPANILFSETAGCFIVEVENDSTAEKMFKNVPFTVLGKTEQKKQIIVKHKKKYVLTSDIISLKKIWKKPMEDMFA